MILKRRVKLEGPERRREIPQPQQAPRRPPSLGHRQFVPGNVKWRALPPPGAFTSIRRSCPSGVKLAISHRSMRAQAPGEDVRGN